MFSYPASPVELWHVKAMGDPRSHSRVQFGAGRKGEIAGAMNRTANTINTAS